MKYRVLFLAGAAIGFILGARAGHERYEQISSLARGAARSAPARRGYEAAQQLVHEVTPHMHNASRQLAQRIGTGAQQLAETVSGTTHEIVDRVSTRSEELQSRVTNTAEDLRRRGEEQIDGMRKRVDEELERGRAAQAEGFLQYGSMREEALAPLEDESDHMLEPDDKH